MYHHGCLRQILQSLLKNRKTAVALIDNIRSELHSIRFYYYSFEGSVRKILGCSLDQMMRRAYDRHSARVDDKLSCKRTASSNKIGLGGMDL